MMDYDPTLRRDTPLAHKLADHIRADGALTMHEYMDACLGDPEHGYYRTNIAIGRDGDFITAPEIGQVFGELIGLWCAVVWQQMGSPSRVALVELGAGRGTLLTDALRAAKVLPAFRDAVSVHILDRNPALIGQQKAALASSGVAAEWHAAMRDLPRDVPAIWIANEFLDTVPANQYERRGDGWISRTVGLDADGRLALLPQPPDWHTFRAGDLPAHPVARTWRDGDIYESQSWDTSFVGNLFACAGTAPFAALFVDYGYVEPDGTDTLQAVRAHKFEHILTSPGEADLSCHVDFASFSDAIREPIGSGAALAVDGPVTQAEFLGRLGIVERTSRLMAANPAKANALEMATARLMAPQGMGTRFKVIGVRSAGLAELPGFANL